jgi:hypothetical protein
MANIKISNLPTWTGTAADIRWFVMNDSSNNETFKYSGYTSQFINGTGTNSYRTPTATASGDNSIAIGVGTATGNKSISIGNGSIVADSSVGIGDNLNSVGSLSVAIGGTHYSNSSLGNVQIGWDTAVQGGSVVLGFGSRATGNATVTLGNNFAQNTADNSVGIGSGGRIGSNFASIGSTFGHLNIGRNHILDSSESYNTILGGFANIITGSTVGSYNTIIAGTNNNISGSTSASTLIGLSNYTPTTSNAVFVENLVVTNYASLDFADDTAADIGGVVLGQVYHTSGALKIIIV